MRRYSSTVSSFALREVTLQVRHREAHLKVTLEGNGATHLASWMTTLGAEASYRAFHLTASTALVRNSLFALFQGKTAQELADAPISALKGVSDGDAELLEKAFGIKTVRDLGTNKYFRWAQSISTLAS